MLFLNFTFFSNISCPKNNWISKPKYNDDDDNNNNNNNNNNKYEI